MARLDNPLLVAAEKAALETPFRIHFADGQDAFVAEVNARPLWLLAEQAALFD